MKKIVILTLVLFFCFVGVTVAEDSSPKIENFKAEIGPSGVTLGFDFSGVSGGLHLATFTIGYKIERSGAVIQSGMVSNLKIAPDPKAKIEFLKKLTGEDGKFKASFPMKMEAGIKPGDKIKYFIFLVDSLKGKSNTVSFELTVTDYKLI